MRVRRSILGLTILLCSAAVAVAASTTAAPAGPERSATADARAERDRSSPQAEWSRSSAPANPLEPFLRQWIDPRHRVAAAMTERKDGTALPTLTTSPRPASDSREPVTIPPTGTGPVETNPYVAAMNASAPSGATPATTLVAPTATRTNAPAPASAASPPDAPPPVPSSGYRPPPARDAKYFPQQKRF